MHIPSETPVATEAAKERLSGRALEEVREPYFDAIRRADLRGVKRGLQRHPPLIDETLNGVTALMFAVKCSVQDSSARKSRNRESVVRFLLSVSCAKTVDANGATALFYAVLGNHVELLRLLIPHSQVEYVDRSGLNALMTAAACGAPDCLRELIVLSDPTQANQQGVTALMRAAHYGHQACAQQLIDANPEAVDAISKQGMTAFDFAVRRENWPCAETLALCGSLERASTLLAGVNESFLPQTAAWVEREALAATLGQEAAACAQPPRSHPGTQSGSTLPGSLLKRKDRQGCNSLATSMHWHR